MYFLIHHNISFIKGIFAAVGGEKLLFNKR